MGNNETIPIVGKGSIMVCTKQGEKTEIQNVYFSPTMKHNLMSVGQLIQNGYKMLMKNDKCEAFILGKQHRLLFNSKIFRRARALLELVHSNLVGPMQTTSIRGSTCFMKFIDDFSRRT